VALTAVLLGGGCAIAGEDRATTVAADEVPYGLLDPTATAPRGSRPSPGTARIEVCLLSADARRLVPVDRDAAGDRSIATVLTTLAEGPTTEETRTGLTTALPASDLIVSASLSRGVATVDLRASFKELTGRNQLLAIGQLVCTATAQPGIGRVSFTIDRSPINVPRGDGSLAEEPVSRDAYASLLR
jgi:spore germination protein GerM